ncbi:hypothetical protein BDV18DRAFT_164652 [Aspergillus unguis]
MSEYINFNEYNNYPARGNDDWMYFLIFVHIEEGASAPHLWTVALVPPVFDGSTEFTTIEISNDDIERQNNRVYERIEVRRKIMRMEWLEADYYNSIRVCQFPPNMEVDFIAAIIREVMRVPEGGAWPNGLCNWLIEAGWLHGEFEEDFHNALMWDFMEDHVYAAYRDRRDRRMRYLAQMRQGREEMERLRFRRDTFSFEEALRFVQHNPNHPLLRIADQMHADLVAYQEVDAEANSNRN